MKQSRNQFFFLNIYFIDGELKVVQYKHNWNSNITYISHHNKAPVSCVTLQHFPRKQNSGIFLTLYSIDTDFDASTTDSF